MDKTDIQVIRYGDYLVSSEIVTEKFCCDFDKCRGVCCIEGDSGAPLEDDECDLLERDYPVFSQFMTDEGRDAAERCGFFEVDIDGDIVTPLVGRGGPCAYSFMEGGKCWCAVERAWCNGLVGFRKPASCFLYPIRVKRLASGLVSLELNRWHICECAFEKGEREGIPVYKFLREPITALFGPDLYEALDAFARR